MFNDVAYYIVRTDCVIGHVLVELDIGINLLNVAGPWTTESV